MPSRGQWALGSGVAQWRSGDFGISFAYGYNDTVDGGHAETKGLSPTGQVITVPLHRHEVELDTQHFELAAHYNVAQDVRLSLFAPYEVRRQRSRVRYIAPTTAADREAAQRNMEIHHRNSTYQGWADGTLLLGTRFQGLLTSNDSAALSVGTTLPFGKIERDPYTAGDQGRRHRHIQFGNGTFDPTAELGYFVPVADRVALQSFATGRFPLYENRHDYRGAIEATGILGVSYEVVDGLSLRGGYGVFYQGFGHWNGNRDENTGIFAQFATGGVGAKPSDSVIVGIDVSIPTHERLLGGGDAFDQAFSIVASVAVEL